MKPEQDDYPTCAETYATLRLYHQEQTADVVTAALGLEPTRTQKIGDTYESAHRVRTKKIHGWFWRTEHVVSSFDAAKHLEHLAQLLSDKHSALARLQADGWRADISCLWDSAYGHGGPTLPAALLRRLADLGIDVWFDVYFHGAYYLTQHEKDAFAHR